MTLTPPPTKAAPPDLLPGGRVLAAPSWVKPGSLAENCAWLAGKVHEVGLLFLESRACLAYGAADLPPWLAGLPLRWHVHLPLDLPWTAAGGGKNGPTEAAEICLALLDKLDFLGVRRAVLHPPPLASVAGRGGRDLFLRDLEIFSATWERAGRERWDLLLENQPETASAADWHTLLTGARLFSCSFCFDFGHFLLHTGDADSNPGRVGRRETTDYLTDVWSKLWQNTRLFHCCTASHKALTRLSPAERETCGEIFRQALPLVPTEAVFMLELFKWEEIELSLPMLRRWLEPEADAGPAFGGI